MIALYTWLSILTSKGSSVIPLWRNREMVSWVLMFLDTRWSGAHMADHELEEGEACDAPESGCDPDTAFAYLDEKLSIILGDVQKFFEGGVSAEKLESGSKFGGYGSFLPTQERTPSILQDKPATVVVSDAYCRSKKSSNEGLLEKMRWTAAGSSVQASNFKASSNTVVVMHENGGREAGLVNEKSNIDSSFPAARVEQNTSLPKKVLLRIKMGSDTNERKKNTTIYSDFGLSNSSSASEGEDVDQDQDSDQHSSPDRTPLTMIRIMTSHHIPDGMLLSPLPDLVTEPFTRKERLWSTNLDVLNEKASSPCSKKIDIKHDSALVKDDGDAFEKMDISREKTREHSSEWKGDSAASSDHVLKQVKSEKEKGGSKESSRHTTKLPSKDLTEDVPKSIEMAITNRDLGREAPEARKRSKDSVKKADATRGTSKEGGKEDYKEAWKSSGKEKHIKTSSSKGPVVDETTKGGPQHSFKTVVNKDFQQVDLPKVQKTESVGHKKKENSKDRSRSDFKEPPKLSEENRQKELVMREVATKALQPACVPEAISSNKPFQSAVPPPETGNVGLPNVLVMDNWVACDNCEKWRLLLPGLNEDHLPSHWQCKMLNWLEGMNNCNVPEEITTKATQALYNITAVPPPSQEILPVLEQIQPPAPVVTSLPPPNAHPSREMKAPEKARAVGNKKRKIPSITSTDTVVLGKSKTLFDASPVIQEASQAKLGGGDTNKDQGKTQLKLGGPEAGHLKVGEEKRKAKEREKAKRSRVNDGASPFGKEHNQTPASLALRDAINLKHTANRFKAALKFLQAASMLESEGSKHGESRQDRLPVNIYADTAKLCQWCASSYESSKDLAAAALSYKCIGLALMRVVQAKSMPISKDRAEIQSAHHQVAPGESPSLSTAMDVDAHNNSAIDRLSARGTASPALNSHAGGSFIISAKSRPTFNRVLQYVADTNAAVEALSKSYNAFAAAESAAMYSVEGMAALKRVLDFSFHDVMNLVQLVRIALEALGH